MTARDQQQLGKTLWSIADQLRGAMNADDFRILIPAAVSCAGGAVIYAMMDPLERVAYVGEADYGHTEAAEGKGPPAHLTEKIRKLIEKEELFRQPNVKISDIAGLLRTNRTYISAAINREMNTSFSGLINGYRIEYAKTLIADKAAEGRELSNNRHHRTLGLHQ